MSLFDTFNQKPENNFSPSDSRDKKSVFIDYVKLQAYEDGYIDRQEEKKLLEYAIQLGIGIDEGQSIIWNSAQKENYVIEREVEKQAKDLLARYASSGGVIDKKEFNDVVGIFMSACKGKFSDIETRRRLKKIILENHWKVKEGGLFGSNWFTEIS
ncbi:conserved hypothetical protein [Gammaproteobacteria bacterium]